MKLTFLGTRGNIDERSQRHAQHTALLIEVRQSRVMVDCGEDWEGRVHELRPSVIVLTHAHPDHAWGLRGGAPCPVAATAETIELVRRFPIDLLPEIRPREPVEFAGVEFEAFPVEHSVRCPAVGYRIRGPRATIFYAPDVAYIPNRDQALDGVDIYIGDGATGFRTMVRKRGPALIGHAPMQTQVTWCRKTGVPVAVFTHCGKHIVAGDENAVLLRLRQWGAKDPERRVHVEIAHDGMQVRL